MIYLLNFYDLTWLEGNSELNFLSRETENPSFFRDSLLEMSIILINKLEISDELYPK